MEVIEKIASIFFSICIIINAYQIKRYTKTWLVPGILFSLFWFLYTFPPLVFLFEIPVNMYSILFIVINVIIFSWTSVFFDWKQAFKLNLNKPASSEMFNTKKLRRFLRFSILFSIVFTILQVKAQGISVKQMFTEPLVSAGIYAAKRYNDGLNQSSYYILSLVFAYLSVLVGGLVYGSSKKRSALLCLIPSVLVMFTQGAKGLFFLSIFLFLGSVLITKLYDNELNLFTKKAIKNFIKAFVLIFIMTIFSFMSRGMQNISDINILYERIKYYITSYAFTHVYGFSDWFTAYFNNGFSSQAYDINNNYLGYYTFRSISRYLAPQKVTTVPGTFAEYFEYGEIIKSNIYTIFRGLIMDFSLIGCIVYSVLTGFLLHLVFYSFLLIKKPVISTAFVVLMIGYFYMNYLISMLNFTVTPISFILFCIILTINKYKYKL